MRVTDSMMFDTMTQQINQNKNDYLKTQHRISSGKAFTNRSEAPSDAAKVASLEAQRSENDQWKQNATQAETFSKLTHSKMTQLVDQMQRAKELTVQANNEALADGDLKNIGNEINNILESVVDIGNSKTNGTYTFAGTETGSKPFDFSRNNGYIDHVTDTIAADPNKTWQKREVQISEDRTSEYGLLGGGSEQAVFGPVDPVDPAESASNTSYDTTEPNDLFESLIRLRDDLLGRDGPAADPKTPENPDDIEQRLNHVISKLAENGMQQQRFTRAQDNISSDQDVLKEQKTSVESANVAEEMVELNELQSAFQASLNTTSRMASLSLTNFI